MAGTNRKSARRDNDQADAKNNADLFEAFSLINVELARTPEVRDAIRRRVNEVENTRSIDLPEALAAGGDEGMRAISSAFRAVLSDMSLKIG